MKAPAPRVKVALLAACICASFAAAAAAQQPQFNIVKPSTTGVPGEEVRVMTFDPEGNLWVAGRWPFWSESGIAMLPADQLTHTALPGGGFHTGAWRVWSNVHFPIPSAYINGLRIAADGTIWIGSEGGLTRFRPNAPPDQQWFTYTPANSPLVVPQVGAIAFDSQGNVWLANSNVNSTAGGVFKLNPATGQWTNMNAGVAPLSLMIGANDRVFITVNHGTGMREYTGTSWVSRGGNVQLGGLLQDANGHIWATSSDTGLWKWNGSSWQNWPQVGGTATITGLGKDRDNVVYVSTWYGGVYKMINDSPVFFVDADNIPRSVIGRPNGDIWISNYGGNGTLGTVRQYTSSGQLLRRMNTYNSGLPWYFIDGIFRDRSGNMWFACGEGGLSMMRGSNGSPTFGTQWRNWGNHNDNSEPYPWAGNEPMYSVFDEGNGIYWMGGNGVGRWDSATGTFTNFWNWQNSNLGAEGITAITKRAGVMWIGADYSGAWRLNGNTWINVPLGSDYSSNVVVNMVVDTQENLWVASEFGVRRFAAGNNSTFTLFHEGNSPLPSSSVTDVEADPTGGVWIATFEGLARFTGSTWTVYNQANSGFPGPLVQDVARRASDGLIAVATTQGSTWPYTGGVSTFNGSTWTHYTRENSPLTHWQVEAVEFDADGNLWASAISEGVVQIMIGSPAAPLQLVSAASRKTHGSSGTFDLPLVLSGTSSVEPRSSGGNHTLVFTFDEAPVSGTAQVIAGTAALAGAPTFSGNTMIVDLAGVSDVQTVSVALSNVTASSGRALPSAAVSLRILAGDTNGNGTVNATDVSQAKALSGQSATQENFRSDVVANGTINATDVSLVKSRSGNTVTAVAPSAEG